jgi:general nucleoside transport system permease protein
VETCADPSQGRWKQYRQSILPPFISLVFALFVSGLIIWGMGVSPILAYGRLFSGAFGSVNSLAETLVKAAPLILTGISFALAMRCGVFNIGAEGQLFMGALASTAVGIYLPPMPPVVHIPIGILAAFTAGGLWGLLAGFLKVRFGASEIITTIMLNYVAILFVGYVIHGPMLEPPGFLPQTPLVSQTIRYARILPGTRLHLGILVSIIALLLFFIFLWKTKMGYEIRVVGHNPEAAKYAGMHPNRSLLLTMLISGGFAGMAGANEVLGILGRMHEAFTQGIGFDGIAVALIGQNSPIGIFLGAFLFGAMRSGANIMQLSTGVPVAVIYIIQALIVLFLVSSELFRRKGFRPVLLFYRRLKGGLGHGK